MERQPTAEELEEARRRGREDAAAHSERARTRPASEVPVVESAGPFEFAPEALREAYERAYEDALEGA
jgi:hypothetical protein